jgi:hypothetical protein
MYDSCSVVICDNVKLHVLDALILIAFVHKFFETYGT